MGRAGGGVADVVCRHAPSVSGPGSAELREQVWNETIEALKKDVPDISKAVGAINS